MKLHAQGKAEVIPVVVRPCRVGKAPFAELKRLPKDGKAVQKWKLQDSAWVNVMEEIEKVIEKIRKKRVRKI